MDSKFLYHVSSEVMEEPYIKATEIYKDFGWGFYCIVDREQANKLAIRKNNGKGVVNTYKYVENSNLKILKFEV